MRLEGTLSLSLSLSLFSLTVCSMPGCRNSPISEVTSSRPRKAAASVTGRKGEKEMRLRCALELRRPRAPRRGPTPTLSRLPCTHVRSSYTHSAPRWSCAPPGARPRRGPRRRRRGRGPLRYKRGGVCCGHGAAAPDSSRSGERRRPDVRVSGWGGRARAPRAAGWGAAREREVQMESAERSSLSLFFRPAHPAGINTLAMAAPKTVRARA